jgi:hypothetical protein
MVQNLAMGGEGDGGEVASPDARGLVEQERIEDIAARSRTEGQAQRLAAAKLWKFLGEDESARGNTRLDTDE